MDCPACRVPLLALEYEGLELDVCARCRGAWLDRGELGQILGEEAASSVLGKFRREEAPHAQGKRLCPRCHARLLKAGLDEAAARLHVDQCPEGDGLWLDHGELLLLAESALPPGHPDLDRLFRFLGDYARP
jgi:Zn-finger nucleic acid-binding protein